jgi:hypothetical protein
MERQGYHKSAMFEKLKQRLDLTGRWNALVESWASSDPSYAAQDILIGLGERGKGVVLILDQKNGCIEFAAVKGGESAADTSAKLLKAIEDDPFIHGHYHFGSNKVFSPSLRIAPLTPEDVHVFDMRFTPTLEELYMRVVKVTKEFARTNDLDVTYLAVPAQVEPNQERASRQKTDIASAGLQQG